MPALYLDAQGAYLRKDGGEYIIQHKQQEQRFPAAQVERVIVLGNVQLSTQVMASLLESGIPVCFLSSHGRYRGRLSPATHANVRLRMKQYECVRESTLAMPYARWFVIGKIRNSKEFICRKLGDAGHDSSGLRKSLKNWMDSAGRTHSIERLRGFEGMAARDYFQAFERIFAGSVFLWKGRNRQPPRDPINGMLSLGYTLLLNECISAIEAIGLDLHAGMLHGGQEHSDYGKPSLALDLMEEFRYLVDRLVMRLLLSGNYLPKDFEKTPNGGCYLRGKIRKDFFSAWESLMQSPIKYDHRRLGYRLIIGEQANLLARALQDENIEYRAFMP
jgi:CRISPR-associated protein Cas1